MLTLHLSVPLPSFHSFLGHNSYRIACKYFWGFVVLLFSQNKHMPEQFVWWVLIACGLQLQSLLGKSGGSTLECSENGKGEGEERGGGKPRRENSPQKAFGHLTSVCVPHQEASSLVNLCRGWPMSFTMGIEGNSSYSHEIQSKHFLHHCSYSLDFSWGSSCARGELMAANWKGTASTCLFSHIVWQQTTELTLAHGLPR